MRLGDVSKTALRTLAARACESASPDALLHDPAAEAAARVLAAELASVRSSRLPATADVIRARIFDDWVAESLAFERWENVINLGAGFCTRFFRLGPPPGAWYEVDLPAVMAVRRQLFSAAGSHVEVAASVLEPGWIEQIPRRRPALLIAEGLLFYLEEREARRLLSRIAGHFPGGTMIFDVLGLAQVAPQQEIETLAGLDAPFRWGVGATKHIERWDPRIRWQREESIFDRCPDRWGEHFRSLRSLRRSHGNRVVQVSFSP